MATIPDTFPCEKICQLVGADNYEVSLTFLKLFKEGKMIYEVRHIPVINKWEAIRYNNGIMTLISRFATREEAYNSLKDLQAIILQ